jgi:riboflavin biosynthesis pyrimidine reductase
MRNFEIHFDRAEPSAVDDPVYAPYGSLGFPKPPPDRPWIYSNFVQSLDGIASFRGRHATGADISQCAEDRWLMDLLRAHADAIVLGVNTLMEETAISTRRGPVYQIEDPLCRKLREKLGRGAEKNIFVTGAFRMNLSNYRVFDPSPVETFVITTTSGASSVEKRASHPHVKIIIAGDGVFVDLPLAMRILRQDYGIARVLCEGGPTLYGYMSRAGLIDEKFLTISPLEIGLFIPPEQQPVQAEQGNPPKERPTTFMAPGFVKENAPWWDWISSRRVGNHEFNRYRRTRPSSSSRRQTVQD